MVQKVPFTSTSGNTMTIGTGTSRVIMGADSGNLKIQDSQSNTSIIEAGAGIVGASAISVVANPAALPFNPISPAGSLAFTTSTNSLYISNGSGWYKISIVNTSPTITLSSTTASPSPTNLTLDFTYTVTEPEGTPTTVSIANSGIATTGNVAVTHTTSNNHVRLVFDGTTKYSGDASVTLSVTDGVNTGTGTITITTNYYVGTNTAENVVLLKATSTGNNDNWDDKSSSNHTITDYGTIEQLAFSPYRDNGYSAYFDGSGDSITMPHDSGWQFGTGDFTVEAWVYPTIIPGGGVNNDMTVWGHFGSTQTMFFHLTNDTLQPVLWNGSAGHGSSLRAKLNEWTHIAWVRSSGTMKTYVDGQLGGTTTSYTTNFNEGTKYPWIGASEFSNRYFKGYITDLRVVKGTAVYSTTFTPPTNRLTAITNTKLLACHLPYLKDGSSDNHTLTVNGNTYPESFTPFDRGNEYTTATGGGSVYHNNGDSDYLQIAASAEHQIYGGDYTVEAWLYPTAFNTTYNYFISKGGNSTREWAFSISASDIRAYWSTNGSSTGDQAVIKTADNNLYEWTHVAFTKSGNTITIYKNGISLGTGTFTSIYSGNGVTTVGRLWQYTGISHQYSGYISNLRIVKGSVVYSSNFTPPTSPVTAITNTKLLLNFTDFRIFDKSESVKRLTIQGDTSASSTQQHFSENTVYFDGTGDYIDIPNPISGTDNHTHEAWVYPTGGDSTYKGFFASAHPSSGAGISVSKDKAIGPQGGSSDLITFSPVVPDNEWSHVVLQRESGVHSLYRNGVRQGTSSTSIDITNTNLRLASRYADNTNRMFGGYMHDFRVTKGLARYPYIAEPVALTTTNSGMTKPDGTTPTVTASNVLLLTCHTGTAGSTTITDGSSNSTSITANGNAVVSDFGPAPGMKSVYFDGTGDYLSLTTASALGTGSWTIEYWVYHNSISSNGTHINFGGDADYAPNFYFITTFDGLKVYHTGTMSNHSYSSGHVNALDSAMIVAKKWYHVAYSHDDSTGKLAVFTNGSFVAEASYSGNISSTAVRIGGTTLYNHMLNGYISNLRVVKGQAIYSANFTPTTSALQ